MPAGKSNATNPTFAGNRRSAAPPPKPSRDHQVHDHEQVVVEARTRDAYQAAISAMTVILRSRERRVDRADDERIADADRWSGDADYAQPQRVQIEFDVGKLGHDGQLPASSFQRLNFTLAAEVGSLEIPYAPADNEAVPPTSSML